MVIKFECKRVDEDHPCCAPYWDASIIIDK